MGECYTKTFSAGFFDLIESDIQSMWKSIDMDIALISSKNWKEHYKEIVAKYSVSGRFALMRILFEKATGIHPEESTGDELEKGFSVDGIGDFRDITIRHAKTLTDAEIADYKRLVLKRVEEHDPKDIEQADSLVSRLLAPSAVGTKCALSRAELLRFGHMADFSLADMQFLLLRSLGDNELGFNHSSSQDVIDMYGFISHLTPTSVESLKRWYRENSAEIEKVTHADKPAGCTRDMANSLERVFARWAPEKNKKEFKKWMLEQAPFLDVRSRSAQRVYTNLAAYAYVRIEDCYGKMSDIIGNNFYSDMEILSEIPDYHPYAQELLFTGGKPDVEKCEKVASHIICENAEYATGFKALCRDVGKETYFFANAEKNAEDSKSDVKNVWIKNAQPFYHVPHIEKGEVTARGKLNLNSKNRIADILADKASPTKSDMLYLLWFIANTDRIGISDRADDMRRFMDDFLSAAERILEASFLPKFYPPNVLESSMMIALALGKSGDDEENPVMVYESICKTFTKAGIEKKPVVKKPRAEKLRIIKSFETSLSKYNSKGEAEKACAEKNGISVKTLQYWRKKYKDGEL